MDYTKGTWVDEILAGDERYTIKENGGSAFKDDMQILLKTAVTQVGTGLTAALMNNIETGVKAIADANNYLIVPSVASNNLTVALKHLDGTNPSATRPLYMKIGNTWRAITAALSVTLNAGTNLCNSGSASLATKEIDYFVYLGYNATDGVTLGVSRIPWAALYSDFSTTSTNEKYCAISTITNAAAGDEYVVIGRFAATLSAGAGYTWTVPTFTSANLVNYPIFETRVLTYTGVLTGFSGTPTQTCRYQIMRNKMVIYQIISGTSNDTMFTCSLPIAALLSTSDMLRLVDNGSAVAGLSVISGATNTFYSSYSAGAWTNSGTKGCEVLTKTVFI